MANLTLKGASVAVTLWMCPPVKRRVTLYSKCYFSIFCVLFCFLFLISIYMKFTVEK